MEALALKRGASPDLTEVAARPDLLEVAPIARQLTLIGA